MNNKIQKDQEDFFLLDSGRVFIRGEINEDSEEKFVRSLRYCISMDIKNIYVYISSEGGDVDSGCAIIDEINGAKTQGFKIHTIALGKAYSAAAYILTFGSVRYATENSSIMLHPILFDLDMDIIKKVANNCQRKTKASINKFIEDMQHGLWLCPKQAKRLKVIDRIWDYSLEKSINETSNGQRT
jgi:ATP-dependent protease ClpP protease subunit